MKKTLSIIMATFFTAAIFLAGCANTQDSKTPAPANQKSAQAVAEKGNLKFAANGEDFVRQGILTKDGWQLTFDHYFVTFSEVTAYQSDPPFEAEKGKNIQAKVQVKLPGVKTVDLAEGDEKAEPIFVGELKGVPAGHFNALSWNLVKATEGPAKGYSIVLAGMGTKDNQKIPFTFKLDQELAYYGGEYVGDERKGIVQKDGTADLEMTFHSDHLFGDGEQAADDEMNAGALGFEPLVKLAKDGKIDVNLADFRAKAAPDDVTKLEKILTHLCHVGEGHCYAEIR